jgi:acyl carrier protein
MMPLQWPPFFQQPVHASWFKQLFTSQDNYTQVMEHLKREIRARPRPDPRIWGDDPHRILMGLLLCKKIQGVHEWPNDQFLPEDPFVIVMLIPWDDLEIMELALDLEEELGFDIPNAEVVSWVGTTLSGVVDRLMAMEKVRTPQSSRRHSQWKRHNA